MLNTRLSLAMISGLGIAFTFTPSACVAEMPNDVPTPTPTFGCYTAMIPSPYPVYSVAMPNSEVVQAEALDNAAEKTQVFHKGSSPGSSNCLSLSPNNDLLGRIWTAAHNFIGTPTDVLPGDGVNSCAAALQLIVEAATGVTIANASVDTWRSLAISGIYGGTILRTGQASQAKAGAIIIWPETEHPTLGHIGVCAQDGCGVTWSNHSDHNASDHGSSFFSARGPAPPTAISGGITMYSAPNNTYLIWEPANIQ